MEKSSLFKKVQETKKKCQNKTFLNLLAARKRILSSGFYSPEKNLSFEFNQSFPKVTKKVKPMTGGRVIMDRFQGDSLHSISFCTTPKRGSFVNQLPACMSATKDDNNMSMSQVFNDSLNSGINQRKAVFTIELPMTEILIVNSVACKLLSYTSDELCGMKLEQLLVDRHKKYITDVCKQQLDGYENGKVVELINKTGNIVPVSLSIKAIDTPQRCLAIAELVERRVSEFSVNNHGKILTCDDEGAALFQYESHELIGVDVQILIPSLNIPKGCDTIPKEFHKQKTTGKTKEGTHFPLSLVINKESHESYQIVIWVYSNLSGVIMLTDELFIYKFNHYFTKILFGLPKKSLINEKISKIIPNFCNDVELSGDKLYDSNSSSSCSDTNIEEKDDLTPQGVDTTELSEKLQEMCVTSDTKQCDCKPKLYCDTQSCSMTTNDVIIVRDGNYIGNGRHTDGSDINILYKVKSTVIDGRNYYCVWITRDPWENVNNKISLQQSNLTLTSSFNSTSLESSFVKELTDKSGRPSSDSVISQCDEILTAGEYCEHYTNLQQIGKGAFGYVKMAFRNSDGFLVITKFIKKQKVNVKSWVVDPQLKMKVPLEISLLTTLSHPNIVQVIDVFHNESFFQLVMEKHGAGLDLFEFIDRKPKTDEKLNSYIFRQIVSAVHYLHSLDILHRDIKDENVIINEKFQVKLIDFGSATFMTPDRLFSTFYGTVEYCSPEVLQGNKYKGPELEIWALGVTLFVLTCGENPFYDIEETIKGKFTLSKQVSPQLSQLLTGMLDKNVETRYTLDDVINHVWVTQNVDVDCYQFEDVVKCFEDESCPPKYISELCTAYDYEFEHDVDDDRTVASSNSFCSLNTIENLDCVDDATNDVEEIPSPRLIQNSNKSQTSIWLTSTPTTQTKQTKYKTSENLTTDVRFRATRNINNKQKRFSLDVSMLKCFNKNTKQMCDSKSCDRFEKELFAEVEADCGEQDLETEILNELQKLKLSEVEQGKKENNEEDDAKLEGEYFDAKQFVVDCDYDNFWDAEEEKYFDNDVS